MTRLKRRVCAGVGVVILVGGACLEAGVVE